MEFLTNYKYFKDRLSKTTAILQDYCHHHFYLYHKNLSDNVIAMIIAPTTILITIKPPF